MNSQANEKTAAGPQEVPHPEAEGLYDETSSQQRDGHAAAHPAGSNTVGWAERLSSAVEKAAGPVNKLAHQMGSEAFLPTAMDKECEKAARILQSFCSEPPWTEVPRTPLTSMYHCSGH